MIHAAPSVPKQSHDRVLRPRELAAYIGLSLATIWRLRRAGSLPEPIRLSANCVGWRTSAVDDWLADRASRSSKS